MEAFFIALLAAVAFGSTWGWIILAAAVIITIAYVEHDSGFAAFFTLLIGFTLLFSLHLKSAAMYVLNHPWNVVIGVALYFVAGTVWGVVKWFLHVTKKLEEYKEKKARFLRSNRFLRSKNATEITPALVSSFKQFLGTNYIEGEAPQVHDHKSDILMWMTYWPFSSVWTLLNDPVRRAFRAIYRSLSTSLQSMSDRLFKTAVAEMNQPLPPEPPKDVPVGIDDKGYVVNRGGVTSVKGRY
jgi:hypothetical protein